MIILSSIILLALLFVNYYAIKFSNGAKKDSIMNSYVAIENQMTSATESYIQEYYRDINSSFVISADNLITYGFLSKDVTKLYNDSCKGYVLVKGYNKETNIRSYIKCNKYETNNFESWRLL